MFGDLLSPVHLFLLLIVALLVFGPKRLPEVGKGLGETLREFRKAMRLESETLAPGQPQTISSADAGKAADGSVAAISPVTEGSLDGSGIDQDRSEHHLP